jgi:hypothetical protein
MNIREELTPTILKMRTLADSLGQSPQSPAGRTCPRPARPAGADGPAVASLLTGLADEIEGVLMDWADRTETSPRRKAPFLRRVVG